MKFVQSLKNNNSGVSAVIGIVMMISITVSIGVTVFSYTSESMQFTAQRVEQTSITTTSTGDVTFLGQSKVKMEELQFQVGGYVIPHKYTGDLTAGTTVNILDVIGNSKDYIISEGGTSSVNILDTNTQRIITTVTIKGTVSLREPPASPDSLISFINPHPIDDAKEQSYPELTWMIIINAKTESFKYSIECSNGQSIKEENFVAKNGNYILSLTTLSPETLYTVTVEAETESGEKSTKTFSFTTTEAIPNNEPVIFNPNPVDGAKKQDCSFEWSVDIQDAENDFITWSISCENGQENSGKEELGGLKTIKLEDLKYETTYIMVVSATDSGSKKTAVEKYSFTTKPEKEEINLPVVFGKTDPVDNAKEQSLSLSWSIELSDPEKDTFSYLITCSNGKKVECTKGAINGVYSLELSELSDSTAYFVTVTATDVGSKTSTMQTYSFTTGELTKK